MSNMNGRFGVHGGQYIPETLMNAVIELEKAYNHYKDDPEFNRELTELLNEYAGRPSRLYYAEKMTKDLGGAKIYLKREDLNHTGSHKINNVLGWEVGNIKDFLILGSILLRHFLESCDLLNRILRNNTLNNDVSADRICIDIIKSKINKRVLNYVG